MHVWQILAKEHPMLQRSTQLRHSLRLPVAVWALVPSHLPQGPLLSGRRAMQADVW
jgi:hypothetical protein